VCSSSLIIEQTTQILSIQPSTHLSELKSRKLIYKHNNDCQYEVQYHRQHLCPRQRWHGRPFRYMRFGEASPCDFVANHHSIDDAVRMEQASAAYEKIISYKRTPATLNRRGPCPEAGSGEIDPCCFDGGPDENCRSRSNCYTRCGPSGPADHGGPGGCVAGNLSLPCKL
jgi:hypothetical protein